jgi:hypothetical protein
MPKNIIQKNARSIEAIAHQFQEQFPLNSRWGSFEVLRDHVKVAVKGKDFTVTSSGLKLSCNRCGLPHSSYSLMNDFSDNVPVRKRKRINILKCGCDFAIVASYVVSTFPDPNNEFGPRLRYAIDRHTEDLKEVKISSASCYDHTNGCQPSYPAISYAATECWYLV